MISVCMGIYNGEKYITQQLQSIMNQTRKADEVILCDDRSTDNTVKIAEKFIEENELADTWKIHQNIQNKGYPYNFYYVMGLCKGDIVFLADQDDVWDVHKIEKMSHIMETHEEIQLLASRWGIIDENGKEAVRTANKGSGRNAQADSLKRISFETILYKYEWPGMAMCYRKELGARTLQRVKKTKLAHDMALALTAAQENAFYDWNEVCQFHRQHDSNVAMEEYRVRKLLNKSRKLEEIDRYLSMLENISESSCVQNQKDKETLDLKLRIMQERKENLEKGSRMAIWKQYRRYKKYIRIETAVCDLLICKK